MRKYSAMLIAKFVLYIANEMNIKISNIKLQKILYFIQNQFLRNTNSEIEENFEAWGYGHVIPKVYSYYVVFGGSYIYEDFSNVLSEFEKIDEKDKEKIEEIVKNTGGRNPWRLVDISHIKGNSWDLVYQDGNGYRDIISKESIKEDDIDNEIY